jgi:NCS1 family nucleobase:cation symporter-1
MNQPKVKYSLSNWDLVTVNPNYKTWNWKDMFCFWGVNIQSVIGFSLIASLYIVYDLNTLVVFFGTILGSFFVYLFSNLIGKPSQKFGLPFTVLLRSSLGFKGAEYFGLLRGLVGIFMFGVQTYFLSKAFGYLIRILIFSIDSSLLNKDIFLVFILGIDIIDWISFTAVIIFQTLMFSIGINFNKRLINYSAITVYGGMLIFFFGVLLSDVKLTSQAFYELLDYKNLLVNDNIFALLTVAGSIFAYFSIIIVSFGDFSRYVKNEDELKKGNLSLIANLIIFSIFSVFIVVGSDVFLNLRFLDLSSILTNPTDIIGKFDNTLITVIAIFFIIISSASTNLVANFIPSQYSLINFLPNSLNLKKASYIILIISFFIGIFWLTVLSQIGILSFVDTFISFFGPLFGVMVADYYLIKSQSISNKDIYSTDSR